MPSAAFKSLLVQLKSVDQLIEIHGKIQNGKGRRHQQDALHTAGVVMTVAAWQAYIEKLIREILCIIDTSISDQNANPPAPNWVKQSFNLRRAAIEKDVNGFNTPNSQNVKRLIENSIGFDPWPAWVWNVGPRKWDAKQTRKRTDDWVRVRHTIAHGYPLPNDMKFLEGKNGTPRLTLNLLIECKKHFIHISDKTDQSIERYLISEYRLEPAWQ